jgi:hypothetical protein
MKLHLYDFDGTLFKSPEYVPDWWDAPGEWSWLSHPLSLTEPCVPLNPSNKWWIQSTVEDAKRSVQDRDTLTIICTGRVKSHKPRIESLLGKAGIKGLYRLYFNPGISAAKFKLQVIENLYKRHSFEEIHIWENENYNHYKKSIESKYGIPCVIHPVHEDHGDYECTPEDIRLDGQDMNITNENQILPPNALRVASTREEMAKRIASYKIAQMEKQAIFGQAKKFLSRAISALPRGLQRIMQGADDREIRKAVRKLEKDEKFRRIVEEAPPKSSLKSLYGYFSFSIKRAFKYAGPPLVVAALLGLLCFHLGMGVAWYLMMLAGLIVNIYIEMGMPNPTEEELERRNRQNAMEIAKGRLLNT